MAVVTNFGTTRRDDSTSVRVRRNLFGKPDETNLTEQYKKIAQLQQEKFEKRWGIKLEKLASDDDLESEDANMQLTNETDSQGELNHPVGEEENNEEVPESSSTVITSGDSQPTDSASCDEHPKFAPERVKVKSIKNKQN